MGQAGDGVVSEALRVWSCLSCGRHTGSGSCRNCAPQLGPSLPVAFCKSCHTQLTFERVTFDRWPQASPTGWRCHCEGCVDGEYVGDPSTLQMSVRSGEGYTIWQALTDCAYMHFDCEPEELMKEGT